MFGYSISYVYLYRVPYSAFYGYDFSYTRLVPYVYLYPICALFARMSIYCGVSGYLWSVCDEVDDGVVGVGTDSVLCESRP